MPAEILTLLWTHREVVFLSDDFNEHVAFIGGQDEEQQLQDIVSTLKVLNGSYTVMVLEPSMLSLKTKKQLCSLLKDNLSVKSLYSLPTALLYSLSLDGNLIFMEEDDSSIQAIPIYNHNILTDCIVVLSKDDNELPSVEDEALSSVISKLPIDCRNKLKGNIVNHREAIKYPNFEEKLLSLVQSYVEMIKGEEDSKYLINLDWYEIKF